MARPSCCQAPTAMRTARNEQIRAAAADILRHPRVIALKQAALGLTAPVTISDNEKGTTLNQPVLDLGDAARWLLANGEPVSPTAKPHLGKLDRGVWRLGDRAPFSSSRQNTPGCCRLTCVCARYDGGQGRFSSPPVGSAMLNSE